MNLGDSWVVPLSGVTSTGSLKQCYPDWVPLGVAPGAAGERLKPCQGILLSAQVKTDGVNAGTIEIWDVSGEDAGADVSSATAITNAQLTAIQNRVKKGLAKLLYTQNFPADGGAEKIALSPRAFSRGLAARYVGSGACTLVLQVEGGFIKVRNAGV